MREAAVEANRQPVEVTGAGRRALVFDGDAVDGVIVAFYPFRPEMTEGGEWLWWAHSVTPEAIDEVWRLIERRGLAVETIVIGGLERYPLFLDAWPRWFVRWSDGDSIRRIVIDTKGLNDEERRRLVELTRRRRKLTRDEDPVTKVLGAIRRLFNGRLR